MLIKGNLTKIESGDQKGELSWITTQVQIQEESSILDLNRRIINRKELSAIGPDRKRPTLYQQLGQWATATTLIFPFSRVSYGSKQVLSASLSQRMFLLLFGCNLPMLWPWFTCPALWFPRYFWIDPHCWGENPFILKVIILLEWATLGKCVCPWKVIKECSYGTISEYPQLETAQMFHSRWVYWDTSFQGTHTETKNYPKTMVKSHRRSAEWKKSGPYPSFPKKQTQFFGGVCVYVIALSSVTEVTRKPFTVWWFIVP